jgi:hypothetical protein
MPRPRKPPRCPNKACNRRMSQLGISTPNEKPVWGCPHCLTVKAGSKKALLVPQTPRWKGDATP